MGEAKTMDDLAKMLASIMGDISDIKNQQIAHGNAIMQLQQNKGGVPTNNKEAALAKPIDREDRGGASSGALRYRKLNFSIFDG